MEDWISVEDRLPPVEQSVLAYSDDIDFMYVDGMDQWHDWSSREWLPEGHVNHWMHLPEPPR